jgi:hypothetical protein
MTWVLIVWISISSGMHSQQTPMLSQGSCEKALADWKATGRMGVRADGICVKK